MKQKQLGQNFEQRTNVIFNDQGYFSHLCPSIRPRIKPLNKPRLWPRIKPRIKPRIRPGIRPQIRLRPCLKPQIKPRVIPHIRASSMMHRQRVGLSKARHLLISFQEDPLSNSFTFSSFPSKWHSEFLQNVLFFSLSLFLAFSGVLCKRGSRT